MIKAVIFDFNGTLFFDGEYNRRAWTETLKKLREGHELVNRDFLDSYHSMDYQVVINNCEAYGIPYDRESVNDWAVYKESLYQKFAIEGGTVLPEGAEEVLDYIKKKGLPVNMATSSIDYNCDFYFKYFNLDRWFDRTLITHDDGTYVNKTKMYEDAARNIGVDMKDVLVFEDTERSINEAIKAGCSRFIYVNSRGIELNKKEILQTVTSYKEIDLSVFD